MINRNQIIHFLRACPAILVIVYSFSFFRADLIEGYGANLYFGVLNHELIVLGFALLLSILCLIQTALDPRSIVIKSGSLFLMAGFFSLTLWMLLAQSWSVNAAFGWKEVRVWLGYGVILWCLSLNLDAGHGWTRKAGIAAVGVLSMALSLAIIYNYYLHGAYAPYIVLNLNRSILGEILILLVPLLLTGSLCLPGIAAKFSGVAGLLGYTAVLVMAQRAPLYGMWTGLVLGFILVYIRFKSFRRKLLIMAGLIVAVTVFYLTPHKLTGGLQDWDSSRRAYNVDQAMDTFQYRITGALTCVFQAIDNPLGTGQGTFTIVFPEYHARLVASPLSAFAQANPDHQFSRAHCEPAQVAGELGIPGIVLWLALFVVFPVILIWHGWRGRQLYLILGTAGILAFSVSSLASSFSARIATSGVPLLMVYVLCASFLRMPRYKILLPWKGQFCLSMLFVLIATAVFWSTIEQARIMHYLGMVEATKNHPQATYQKKMRHYAEMLRRDPSNPVFPYLAANAMAAHGNLKNEHSAELWRLAIERGLFSAEFVCVESYAYWLRGDKQKALETVESGLRTYPNSWRLLSFKAAYLEKAEGAAAAEKYWQLASDLRNRETPVIRKILTAMINQQDLQADRQELFLIQPSFYSLLNALYFNSYEDQRSLPPLLRQNEDRPRE